jgi:hypothetical protein
MNNQASPLLRSDFAQSTAGHTPNGDLTDSFVPSDGRAPHREQSDATIGAPGSGKVTNMCTTAPPHPRWPEAATGREPRSAES